MTGGVLTKKIAVYAAQDEGREGCPRRPADHRLRRGEEDREVRDPATHDAEAEAQARTEGGQEDDVREGGEGGGACLLRQPPLVPALQAPSTWLPPPPRRA